MSILSFHGAGGAAKGNCARFLGTPLKSTQEKMQRRQKAEGEVAFWQKKKEGLKFLRIDADVTDTFKETVKEEDAEGFKADTEKLTDTFKKALNNDKLEIKVEKLKNDQVASMIIVSEESRRMQDMMKMYNMYGMDPSMLAGRAGHWCSMPTISWFSMCWIIRRAN